MREHERREDVEFAGALAPELEGAPHSRAHRQRSRPPARTKEERGDQPSARRDSPQGPSRP